MKILGVDISSRSTGWAIIQDDKLLDYGKIVPSGKMSLGQKLCLFGNEISKVIEKYKPDEIAIEDVVQVSSVSVTKILSRFNGVAIIEAYKYLQRDPPLYAPSEWKKVLDGCTGGAKKCDVQLSVCAKYDLLSKDRVKHYKDRIDNIRASVKETSSLDSIVLRDNQEDIKKSTKEQLKQLKRDLRKAVTDEDIKVFEHKIELLKQEKGAKTKANKKIANEEMDKISLEIYSETSINDDIADSIGVAIARQKELS
jgi:Holliday junction resolvasome RuvABC endonuclease subunit